MPPPQNAALIPRAQSRASEPCSNVRAETSLQTTGKKDLNPYFQCSPPNIFLSDSCISISRADDVTDISTHIVVAIPSSMLLSSLCPLPLRAGIDGAPSPVQNRPRCYMVLFLDLFLFKPKGFQAWQGFPSKLSSQTERAQRGMSPKPDRSS